MSAQRIYSFVQITNILEREVVMAMKSHVSKIKAIVAFMLALFLAMPFVSSVASAYVMAAHTHICHDEEHRDDCDGTKECCKICQSIGSVKNRPLYYNAAGRLPATPAPALSFSVVNIELQHISSASLISLKVRLNN